MKNLVTVVILLFVSILNANAQDNSKILLGGSLGIDLSNYSGDNNSFRGDIDKTFQLSTSPFIGYFISKNFLSGIAFENNILNVYYESDDIYLSSIKQSEFLFNPFLRYYFNVPLFIQSQFNIGRTKQTLNFNPDYLGPDPNDPIIQISTLKSKNFTIGFSFGIGYDIDLYKKIKLEPLIKYVRNKYSDKENETSFKTSSLLLNLGFVYRL